MAKFHGIIGYAIPEETKPGVWMNKIIERYSDGDVIVDNAKRLANPNSTNDNLTINNRISIIADPFADQHYHSMIYVEFYGTKWKITSIDVQYPRLILNVGGVYNGKQA